MGRSPRCSKDGLNKGAWTTDEDKILTDYVKIHGEGKWSNVAKKTGLRRCGKSCRLRWMNYLRPDIKRGNISHDEKELIIRLHKLLGNRWSLIAGRLPGRTDNEIKNYWNTNLAKKATDQVSVHSINEKNAKIRHLDEHEAKPAVNTANYKANSLPAAGTVTGTNNVVFVAPPEEYKGGQIQIQNHNNNNVNDQVLTQPYVDGNWQKHTKYYETDLSSDGSPSSASREDHENDFMIDFDMDDFCKMLDSDFAKLNGDGDGIDINNGCKAEASPDDFGDQKMKMEDKCWRSSSVDSEGVVQTHDMTMSSEFLSLASSFLDSAADQEWPGDDLNIAHAHA